MKRIVSLAVSLLLVATAFFPVQALAQEDKGLERIIRTVKGMIDIPEGLTEFNYNVYEDSGKDIWNLSWNSKDGVDGGMNAAIDEDGTLRSYYSYRPYIPGERDTAGRFPKVSRQQAEAAARGFIGRVNPGALAKIELRQDGRSTVMEDTYNFQYVRQVNGIPFYHNNINVSVDSETGEVRSYYYNWTEDLEFANPGGVIPVEEAWDAYKEKLGLELAYSYMAEDETYRIYPVYIPVFGSNTCIDAFTGDRVDVGYVYSGRERGMSMTKRAKQDLSPEELKAVDEVSKLLTKEQAEKAARGAKLLEVTGDFKLTGASLQKDWNFKEHFTWDLNFVKEASGKGGESQNIGVRVNANTGEIKGFYRYMPYQPNDKARHDREDAKKAAVKFLEGLYPAKFKQFEYDEWYREDYRPLDSGDRPTRYNFRFVRKANGIRFPANEITLGFDAVNGKVTNFEMNWYPVQFPSLDGVVSMDKVYQDMFRAVGLELQYTVRYPDDYRPGYEPGVKPEVRLVYTVKPGKPLNFDAYTGAMLDHDGKPYKENKPPEYTDISGHFAEQQIVALAEYGIALDGTEFRPDGNISQKDFLLLLAKTLYYHSYGEMSGEDDREAEQMYNYLIKQGIVRKEEQAPAAEVLREEGVKFLIRALKYDRVADLKGIYKTSFKDEAGIDPDLVGYVAIARGMGIVGYNDGYFNPKGSLTRGQTMVMIYNYLTR